MTTSDAGLRMTEVDYDPFAAAQFARSVPTTDSQREVWLAAQLGREATLAFNESITIALRGALDLGALQRALQVLAQRHEALRATFDAEGENMLIAESGDLDALVMDLSGVDPVVRQARLAALRAEAVEQVFDLQTGPLLRAVIIRCAPDEHELLLTAHHIVCDGWAFGVLSRDLMAAYHRLAAGRPTSDLAPADSFGDYALAIVDREQARAAEADERYWVSVFDGGQPVLDLPTDRSRGRGRSFASRREDHVLPQRLIQDVRKLGAKQGVSLFASLFGVFAGLMGRLGGEGDVVIGVPSAGQSARGLDHLVGHCVNLLPVRIAADGTQSVAALLKQAGTRVLDAYDHQSCTFGRLLTKLNVPREANRLPLVSVQFNIDSPIPDDALSGVGLQASLRSNPRAYENFELFFNASQTDNGIVLECQYHCDLFDAETIRRWLTLFETALERAVADSMQPVAALFGAAEADLARLTSFNQTAQGYPTDQRIEALVFQQAERTPEATAVISGESRLTYRELEQQANSVAHALLARGVGPGQLVGMACGRNPHMLAAMLGILKTGAAYVPLDPAFPTDRLTYMCQDAALRWIISDRSVAATGWSGSEVLWVEDLPATSSPVPSRAETTAPAYVIYTSGSTGKPKGVVVHQRGVVNFLTSMARQPGLTPSDRLVAVTTTSFDIAVLELFLPLTVGAKVIIADRDTVLDGAALRALIERHKATVLQATPAGWRLLIDADWIGEPGFKALVGGEALADDLAHELVKRAGQVWNMYGPTETTVWSTCWQVPSKRDGIRIGQPIANTSVLVLDEAMRACPLGVPGELFIGGDSVATGYWRRPELTAERFVNVDGQRFYRTGDRGRWRNDGTLEHLGRLDFQVKVRGYRIELGEIEAALVEHDSIERAVVVAREDVPGDVTLVAYVVPKAGQHSPAKVLRAHLRKNLPDYMLPAQIVRLGAIPLLPNGKVNRAALPSPNTEIAARNQATPPSTPTETKVLEAMEQVLNLRGLGVDEDFFSLGGHSLLASRLMARLGKSFDAKLPLRMVFEHSSARQLSIVIDSIKGSGTHAASPRLTPQSDQDSGPLTVMQELIRFMEQLHPGRVTYNTPSAHRLRGPFDREAFETALRALVQRQPALRTSIDGSGAQSRQRVAAKLVIDIPFVDLSSLPAAAREPELMRRLYALIDQPIGIDQAPLFRVGLWRLGEQEHVFFFMAHHIIWDGWSFDLLYREMADLYPAALEGRKSALPSLPVTYLDFTHWHQAWAKSEECREQINYWRNRFALLETPKVFPLNRPRGSERSSNGNIEWVRVDKALTERLRTLAGDHGTTLNMLILALYAAMIGEIAASPTVVLGLPVRGRTESDVENVMGLFINLLPTPFKIQADLSLPEWLKVVKKELLNAFAHQDVPYARLLGEPEVTRHANRGGLYQSLFSFQDARERERNWGPLQHSSVLVMQRDATEDLGLWLMEVPNGLEGGLNYNTELFDAMTARMLRDRLLVLLERAVNYPDQTLSDLLAVPRTEASAQSVAAKNAENLSMARIGASVAIAAGGLTREQQALADIWARLLGIDVAQIAAVDNFFDLGGSSLLVMRAVVESRALYSIEVEPQRYIQESLSQLAATSTAGLQPSDDPKAVAGIAAIWARLIGLDVSQIEPGDNFFDLGGNSILAMQAVAAIDTEVGLKIDPVRLVYETLSQLARGQHTPVAARVPFDAAVETKGAASPGLLNRVFGRLGRRT